MSMCYNDFIIASNNSINENKYNTEKLAKSPSYRIKKILKPILRILRQKPSSNKKSQKASNRKLNIENSLESNECYYHDDFQYQNDFWSAEMEENLKNEELESRIHEDIAGCDDNAAVWVYDNNECYLQAVDRETKFIPVHFARTDAGTFFWTTMEQPIDDVETASCWSHCGDRWVQA